VTGYIGFQNNIPETAENKFNWVADNTGNLLFDNAIKKIIDADLITDIDKISSEKYDAFITTAFIWLRYNDSSAEYDNYYTKLLSTVKEKPLIPMSVGIQSDEYDYNFKIYKNTVHILAKMSERCVLGVRGNYTAEILNKYGIKNMQVIGCPSAYYHFDYNFCIKNIVNPKNCCVNFKAFYGSLKEYEQKFLIFSAEKNFDFIEQNAFKLTEDMCEKKACLKINDWLADKTQVFFSVEKWINYMYRFDFTMGYRFHGNIAALYAGVPSLFIVTDSRTAEMCEFFKFPVLKAGMFETEKPLEYYAELADYTKFNKNYPVLIDNFMEFCKINHISLKNQP